MAAEQVTQGVGRIISKQIRLADGITPSAAYLPMDTLAARVWEGDSEGVLFAPAATWDSVLGPPTFNVEILPADTRTLAAGVYAIQVIVTRPSTGQTALAFEGQLEITAAPGTATHPAVYIQLSDLQAEMPNISSYQQQCRDETGFEAQRAKARMWLDELCHRNVRAMAGISSMIFPAEWPYRNLIKNPQFQRYLDAGYLWLSQPLIDSQVYYTLSLVFRGLVPSNPDLFMKLSNEYKVRAELALRGCTAQVMGPDGAGQNAGTKDGVLLTMIDFSASKMLRA